ncbi:ste11-like protein [Schizophyllum amplum]|uniref:mitogen-activated protein kinase kinase kinase n=1 Tax=Schizophyllum amplum TaxID=97359 RepID=A0A550BUI9_9AGAR|nr:ste11-like protein [Auriculariopsis ampla]
MSAVASYTMADMQPSSPATPTFQTMQTPRSQMALNGIGIRGHTSPFPTTPTASHMNTFLEPPSGMSYADFIRTWNDTHVARWLTDIKCGGHAATFKDNDIRGDVLLELDQATLKEMGIASIGDRLRIVNAVKTLRQRSAAKAVTIQTPVLETNRTLRLDTDVTMPFIDIASPVSKHNSRGRPAPLQLSSQNRTDLPRVVQPPDSARMPPARPNATPSSRLPPVPRGQPPPPPGRGVPSRSGRRTPTQEPAPPPAYTNQALPPAPTGQTTPQWAGYHLPTDPRSKLPTPSTGSSSRSTSPLPAFPSRSRTNTNPTSMHGRNGSLGVMSPTVATKLPPRPSTTNATPASSHPYATAQAQTPDGIALSPISEAFIAQTPQSASTNSPSPPAAYTVGRGPFNAGNNANTTKPLIDIKSKILKFNLQVPDERTFNTYTIDVSKCAGGVEVIERVLKKAGKRSGSENKISAENVQTDGEGLFVDGWAVYKTGEALDPLTEAELLSYCHAPGDHPVREQGLTLRKATAKPRAQHGRFLSVSSAASGLRNTKRASTLSVLSGLGVHDTTSAPEDAPAPPSVDEVSSPLKRPSKLRHFFGQRPPSELITTHLTEYFPNAERKVLARTARNSMMRMHTPSLSKRDSAAWNATLASRFSSSTVGSGSGSAGTRASMTSMAPPPPEKTLAAAPPAFTPEELPRMSISTEDGHSVPLSPEEEEGEAPKLLPPIPFPTESLSEGLENFTAGAEEGSRAARPLSRRMSYMTELRSKRDVSDTASLMTVDEITAEVESRSQKSRRESRMSRMTAESEYDDEEADEESDGSPDTEDWTEVEPDSQGESATLMESVYDEEEDEEDDEPKTMGGGEDDVKWIKGALIGAGSFGKVYLGMEAESGLLMAVKQVELPTGSAPNLERKKSMLSALEREIELLKDLQHVNIVQYLYSSLDEDHLNIFLEYVPGGSVTALLRNYGAFEEPLVKNFVRQILCGLDYLHERDIIHRDIKGANILVDNKGGVKISDFGISKKVEDTLSNSNRMHRPSLQGSVFWMAPEVVKQSGHTKKADIWSMGCLIVEMLTGEHPWAQLTQMQAIFKIGSSAKPSIPTDISAEAEEFLQRAFELDHEARPSAAECLQHLWLLTTKSTSALAKAAAKAAAASELNA